MDAWVWIVIAIVVAALLAIGYFFATRGRARREEQRRLQARELREQSEAQARRARERGAAADQLAERARDDQREAELAAQRANEIDPDVD